MRDLLPSIIKILGIGFSFSEKEGILENLNELETKI